MSYSKKNTKLLFMADQSVNDKLFHKRIERNKDFVNNIAANTNLIDNDNK